MTSWRLANRADASARQIADRHYSRQTIGAEQFVPPGRCMVLVIPGCAYWVTSWPFKEYVKHAWAGAWVCSAFRNERRDLYLSSDLVTEAIAITRWYRTETPSWRVDPEPELGMVTFVDERKVRRKRDPGRCFRKAGFVEDGRTVEEDLVALRLVPSAMPAPMAPLGAQGDLFAALGA